MIILIAGATHTGKTRLAQSLLEKYKYPYFSIDHLKMGLIRSGSTGLTVYDDEELTPYLWNIVREMVKTAIENKQNLIVEGCYIPFDWAKDFEPDYLKEIKYYCLVMTSSYIEKHFDDIRKFANAIEKRGDDSDLTQEELLADNARNLAMCKSYGLNAVIIDGDYNSDIDIAVSL